jgi:hypothetical protein
MVKCPSSSARGYDAAWRTFRRNFLARHPVYKDCGGRATEAHHEMPIADFPFFQLSDTYLTPLCRGWNSKRTRSALPETHAFGLKLKEPPASVTYDGDGQLSIGVENGKV